MRQLISWPSFAVINLINSDQNFEYFNNSTVYRLADHLLRAPMYTGINPCLSESINLRTEGQRFNGWTSEGYLGDKERKINKNKKVI